MIVKNKWNGKLYEVVKDSDDKIELKRLSDGTIFTIAKSEYTFSYKLSEKKEAIEK